MTKGKNLKAGWQWVVLGYENQQLARAKAPTSSQVMFVKVQVLLHFSWLKNKAGGWI